MPVFFTLSLKLDHPLLGVLAAAPEHELPADDLNDLGLCELRYLVSGFAGGKLAVLLNAYLDELAAVKDVVELLYELLAYSLLSYEKYCIVAAGAFVLD